MNWYHWLILPFQFVVYGNGLLYTSIALTFDFSFRIATKFFEGVRTAHATFKSLLTTIETPIRNIAKQSNFAKVLKTLN